MRGTPARLDFSIAKLPLNSAKLPSVIAIGPETWNRAWLRLMTAGTVPVPVGTDQATAGKLAEVHNRGCPRRIGGVERAIDGEGHWIAGLAQRNRNRNLAGQDALDLVDRRLESVVTGRIRGGCGREQGQAEAQVTERQAIGAGRMGGPFCCQYGPPTPKNALMLLPPSSTAVTDSGAGLPPANETPNSWPDSIAKLPER